jgi:hypothetical protein
MFERVYPLASGEEAVWFHVVGEHAFISRQSNRDLPTCFTR